MSKSNKGGYNPSKYKQGRISKAEIDFVAKHLHDMSDAELSNSLNRRIETVQDIKTEIMARGQGVEEVDGKIEIKGDLHKRPEWAIWKQQFTQEELALFKVRYSQLVSQFNNDVMITEDLQLLQAIQFEILMNRALIEIRRMEQQRLEFEEILNEIRRNAINETDREELARLSAQRSDITHLINGTNAALKNSNRDYGELQEKHSKLMASLKATRNQRLDKIEKQGDSVFDLFKYLSEKDNQERESRQHELVKLGVKREEKRLSKLHTFQDGTADRILLTPENANSSDGDDDGVP